MLRLWWPVTLIVLAAPFAVHGWHWLDQQRTLHAHARQLDALRETAEQERAKAYGAGHAAGVAEVRALEWAETEKTKRALEELEYELEKARAEAVPSPTPAEILALCKVSASCRERRELK
jgi:hypothetical protein